MDVQHKKIINTVRDEIQNPFLNIAPKSFIATFLISSFTIHFQWSFKEIVYEFWINLQNPEL